MRIITKGDLQNLFLFDPKWEERDFVKTLEEYVNGPMEKVLLLSGLRGTGKTVGLLQLIPKFNDIVYITAEQGESEDAAAYLQVLRDRKEKIILLDEYTWIRNRAENGLDGFFDTLVHHGKKVILTGTESMSLEALKAGALIHRAITVHTNYISFQEFCRLKNLPMTPENNDVFLKTGGVFEEYAIQNYATMSNYIQTAIIDNLKRYVVSVFPKFNTTHLTNIVYSIFYKAIRDMVDVRIPIRDRSMASLNKLSQFGVDIDEYASLDPLEVKLVSDILAQVGVIVKIPNLIPREKQQRIGVKDERMYIVNPSLTWQLLLSLYDEKMLGKSLLGFVYESTCVVGMYYHKFEDDKLYFVETDGEFPFELDFVIIEAEKTDKQQAFLFECKHAYSINLNSKKAQNWTIVSGKVEDIINELNPDGEIAGRYIIHPGECSINEVNGKEILIVNQEEIFENYYNYDTVYNHIAGLDTRKCYEKETNYGRD